MKERQDQLRKRILHLKKDKGISYVHITRNCKISQTLMTLFIQDKLDLSLNVENRIREFLDKNYS